MSLSIKEQGNEAFKNQQFGEALQLYTRALNSEENEGKEKAILLKNRAAVYLKLEQYEEAIQDCNACLELIPNEPKALFRRCQAFEQLQKFEEAYKDANAIFRDDPANKTIQPILARLHKIIQEKINEQNKLGNKIETMLKLAFNFEEKNIENRENAMKNLMILSKEKNAGELLIKSGILPKIKTLLKIEKNAEIRINTIRIIGELVKHNETQTKTIIKTLGIPWFLEILDSTNVDQVNCAQYCIQQILYVFANYDPKTEKVSQEATTRNKNEIDMILTCLTLAVNNRAITGQSRDAIIELLIRNIHHVMLNWSERLVEIGGVARLLECASEIPELKYESAMNITKSTATIAAVCLSRIYENMYYDSAKERYLEKIQDFIKEKLLNPEVESKIRVAVALTSLLRGPLDVGNTLIGKEGIIEMILVMANSGDSLQQKVAVECIIAAASKADKAKSIIAQGINILKDLYKNADDGIRVRALVGLCKLGSSGGTDSTLKPFEEGANLKLAEACRKFLLNPSKNDDLRKWASEGLSYLTLDAEVKEALINDKPALLSLIELAKTGDQSCLFGVVTTLVNLTNSYDKQDIQPEMLELAKFAKQHIPETHELDDPDFVAKRIEILAKSGVTTALVALSATESENSRELISRVFNALCGQHELRGLVVSQGGSKALIPLSIKGSEMGKRHASQALARIAITMNPEVAFPGQRALEIVKPLLNLLHQDFTALENFEALMALCNIAQMGETARKRILNEGGLSKIEHYLYEDHLMLSRAATQCITNLSMSEAVVEIYEGANDRVKFLVSVLLEDDGETVLAASGALAILTNASVKICEKIFDSKNWLDVFHVLLANCDANIQYRGVTIVRNVMESSKELCEKLMESDVLEILMALVKTGSQQVVRVAEEGLGFGEKWGVIMKPKGGLPEIGEGGETS